MVPFYLDPQGKHFLYLKTQANLSFDLIYRKIICKSQSAFHDLKFCICVSNKQQICKNCIRIYLEFCDSRMAKDFFGVNLDFILWYYQLNHRLFPLFDHMSANDLLITILCIDGCSTIQFSIYCKQIYLLNHSLRNFNFTF